MTFKKCPRCDLNYILDGGELCTVCRREVRGESLDDDNLDMCSECGENPALPGSEYCARCLKEVARRNKVEITSNDDVLQSEDAAMSIDNDSVSSMDELVIGDTDSEPFDEDDYSDGRVTDMPKRGRRSQDDEFESNGFSIGKPGENGGDLNDGLRDF